MGRKRRKSRPPILASAPQEEDFHRPFSEVREKLREVATRPVSTASTPKFAPAPHRQTPDPMSRQATVSADERARRERALFLSEMAGVTPLPKDPRGQVGKPRPQRRVSAYQNPDALDELRDFVEGRGAFSIQCTDEYMEGVAPGVDQRLAQRLHRGDFAVQAQCDLHGHTAEEAKIVIQRFVTQAHTAGQRCVRVIHGRGRNSRDNRPVLKEQVQLWLSHGRLSRLVLAFATAPATDGGAGAVYVLLRRASRQHKPSG